MVWRAALDAKCDYFKDTWFEYTGRTMVQECGDGWAEGVHRDDFDRCVGIYLDHFGRCESFEMEYRLRHHDGEFRWIFDRGVLFTNDGGEFAGFIGSCVDVHDRRIAQDAQQRYNQEQLALARDFEKWILAIVSHDIRDPLNAIQLGAQVLSMTAAADSVARKQAEGVARAAGRIRHIVGDLLDLSRQREGEGITVDARSADMRLLCQRIVDEVRTVAIERHISLQCDVEGHGFWDKHRILQAISNLTSNAIQHGRSGTPVRVRLTGDERTVAVEVCNEGSIPNEVLPRIFEPFRSGRHHGARGQGLGLGLFIARAIAIAHGGGIEVESDSGATTFRLLLPRRPPLNAAAATV